MIFGSSRLSHEGVVYTLPLKLLGLGVLAVLAGIFLNQTWLEFPVGHSMVLLVIGASACGLGLLLRLFFGLHMASGLTLIFALILVWLVGIRPVVSCLLLAAAAAGLGSHLVPVAMPARWAVALIAGLAILAGGLGWVVSIPGHGFWWYLVALLLLVLLSRKRLHELSKSLVTRWSGAITAAPSMAALAVMALGLAGVTLWLPDLAYDDLAYHLALPFQLTELGYYRLDPATQIWALAPWAGDLIQAIAHVVSDASARGAVNALWLVLSGVLLWSLGREIGLDAARAWLTIALYGSMPLTAMLAFGQQTEGPTIAILLALALLILRAPLRPDAATLQLAAVLAGFLLALKLSNVLSAAPMGIWLLWRWRFHLPWRAIPTALALFVLISGSSYFHAWALAGNPVLPLYSDIFQSQFMVDWRFEDARWIAGLDWTLPWRLTFDTSSYLESWPGGAGFLLVSLVAVLPLVLIRSQLRPLALAGLAAFLLPLMFVHYLRYAQPGLVLLLPALIAGLDKAQPRRLTSGLLIAMVVLNLGYQGNVNWMFRDGVLSRQIQDGRTAVVASFAPEIQIAEWLRDQPLAHARILLIDPVRAYIAPFSGQAFARNWYDREIHILAVGADNDPSGESWRQAWHNLGMTHILTVEPLTQAVQAALVLAEAEVEYAFGDARLWRLPQPGTRDLMQERDLAHQRRLGFWAFP